MVAEALAFAQQQCDEVALKVSIHFPWRTPSITLVWLLVSTVTGRLWKCEPRTS